jgi:hypothetical protein
MTRASETRKTPTGDETMKTSETITLTDGKILRSPAAHSLNERMTLRGGLVVEWDAKEGCYYDPSTDLFISIEDFNAHAGLRY